MRLTDTTMGPATNHACLDFAKQAGKNPFSQAKNAVFGKNKSEIDSFCSVKAFPRDCEFLIQLFRCKKECFFIMSY